jgi:hypothetical protein
LNRWLLATFGGVVGLMIVMAALPWLRLLMALFRFHDLVVGLLVGLEVAYLSVLTSSLMGLVVFGGLYEVSRRRGKPWRGAVRWLFACSGCLLGIAMAETTAFAWLDWGSWSRERSMATSGLAEDFPLPTVFPEESDPGEVNLVVVGESSAVGFPCQQWLSVGRILTWQLGRAIPSRRFHAEIVAHEGDTLELQHRKLARIKRRPDAVIVYCGHNEFVARYPAQRDVRHYLDEASCRSRRMGEAGLSRWSPFCQLLHRIADGHRVGIAPRVGDRRLVADVPVYSPADFSERLADFQRRLERIADFCRRVGTLAILVVPPGNDADFEPNRSFLNPATTAVERQQFVRRFLAIRQAEPSDPEGCIQGYRDLLSLQPGFAEAHFRLARLLERSGHWEEAYDHYAAARDHDGLPIRCPGPLQEAYRSVARQYDALLVDGQEVFHAIGRHGLLNDHLFHDAMHPSVRGHIALAEAILKGIQARRAFGWAQDVPPPLLDPAATAAHFGIVGPVWKTLCERGAMFYYGYMAARYDPSERIAKHQAFLKAAERIAAGEAPDSVGLPNIGIDAASGPIAAASSALGPDAENR